MAMPAKQGFWLDQMDGALPVANNTCQQDHEPALVRLEARSRNRSRGNDELLAQKRILRDEFLTRPERVLDEPDEDRCWPCRRPSGGVHPSHHAGDDASSPSSKRPQHSRDCRDRGVQFKSCSARILARSWGGCE